MAQRMETASRLRAAVDEIGANGGSDDLQVLTRKLFEDADHDDLAALAPEELASLAADAHDFLRSRKLGRAAVRLYNPNAKDGRLRDVTVIEIVNDDMPFLVDSTLALISARGHQILLVLHPVLVNRRGSAGLLEQVCAEPGKPGTVRESFMHIQVGLIASREERDSLQKELLKVLGNVRTAVLDWQPMQQRVKDVISQYQENPPPVPVEELTESMAFLQWLHDNHFTFLGMREYSFEGGAETGELKPIKGSGLGILRDPDTHVMRRGDELVTVTPEIRAFLLQPAPLFITKSDVVADVHRRALMDYIGIKRFDADGQLAGELRAVGLFTSTAYTRSPRDIPLIRRKISTVIQRSGFRADSHSGKGLLNVLETLPRDELFQIDAESLGDFARGVLRLEERPRTRLFVWRDKFDRFVSAFVYISRDRFNSRVRERVGDLLAEAYGGQVANFSPSFGEGTLVRVHFTITRDPAISDADPDVDELEAQIAELVRTWEDRLMEALDEAFDEVEARRLKRKYRGAFSPGYQEVFPPQSSIYDIREIEALSDEENVAVEFYRALKDPPDTSRLKLYHFDAPIPLSDRLPILECMGLRAIEEKSFTLTRHGTRSERTIFIHEVLVEARAEIDVKERSLLLEDCFLAVWNGLAENDEFNALVLKEGLVWRDAAALRACARYLRQAGIAFSPAYLAQTLVKHSAIARKLVEMFQARFDPEGSDLADRVTAVSALTADIEEILQSVPSLDEDRIVRRFVGLILAMLRTNFFRKREDGSAPASIAFKIRSRDIDELPDPKPFAEIFVYAPDVEGVHLRGGMIARGGLRWSDRPEDFRTEVLGLQKAQNVKNAVIVPVGAKGGFVPKRLPNDGAREDIFAEGKRAYQMFVSTLLEITDNVVDGEVVPPEQVVRYDGDDAYLVVAADKGTATFSDTANAISAEHDFWLDDAFASGGSAGYDHKEMGITARGAWEAVKRHFREMDVDIQTTPFTVIGCGDMSGDVFGNGMLLSQQIRLLAAFDHRDIFIDPDPDPAASFAERKRLFELPRSSWKDYDEKLISDGGGIFSRQLKSIPLSPQMQALTGLKGDTTTPNKLIREILKIEADLMWLGGIGTYIRAAGESDADVGDRTNDALRITAAEMRVKVVGEGANLGLTQRARIEFARRGGRINTDAVDNSAGVNSSDLEVNIKIALSAAERAGALEREGRNELLAEMTNEVAQLVLRNNYLQTLCLSLSEARGMREFDLQARMMRDLERDGPLDRRVEDLPDEAAVAERRKEGQTLTRPEIAVLMAYAKIVLFDQLLNSTVLDDDYLREQLFRYFPDQMKERYAEEIAQHKLRREIIATMLANSMINRGGPTFVYRLAQETGHDINAIASAFTVARDTYGVTELNGLVDDLDNRIAGELQIELYLELQSIVRRVTMWFLRNENFTRGLESLVAHYGGGVDELRSCLDEVLPQENRDHVAERISRYVAGGVPEDTAQRIAGLRYLQRAPDISRIAAVSGQPIRAAAEVYFVAGDVIGLGRIMRQANRIEPGSFYERLAVNRTLDSLFTTHRNLVIEIMSASDAQAQCWSRWHEENAQAVERIRQNLDDVLDDRQFGLPQLAVAASYLSDLFVTT